MGCRQIWIAVVLAVAPACGGQVLLGPEAEADEDGDVEADGAPDGDVDAPADAGADADSDADRVDGTGTTWARTYGMNRSWAPVGAAIAIDAAGVAVTAGNGLLRIDLHGDPLWDCRYNADPITAIAAADGGWTAAGLIHGIWTDGEELAIERLGADGSVAWARSYASEVPTYNKSIRFVVPAAAGGAFLGGFTDSADFGMDNIWLLDVAPSGEVVWSRAWGADGYDRAFGATDSGDGGLLLVGSTDSFNPPFGFDYTDPLVLRLAADGTTVWIRRLAGTVRGRLHAARPTPDHGFLVGGSMYAATPSGTDVLLAKLTADGELEWARTFGSPGEDVAVDLEPAGDGDWVVAALTDGLGAGGRDFWILRLDADGAVEWQRTYGGLEHDEIGSLLVLPDGGLLLAGTTGSYPAGGGGVWVLRTDAAGDIALDCPAGMIEVPVVEAGTARLTAEDVVFEVRELPVDTTVLTRPGIEARGSTFDEQCGR
ncbi:MAG: hypothetical protein HY905_05340 [Deltaproteobacteria bacterium]|nr:hypothetical protein [Deltaproteobacteria bacterium]